MKKLIFLSVMAMLTLFAMAQVPVGVEIVDLGLPSGLKWANMNVGATTEEGYGNYFSMYEAILASGDDAAHVNWGGNWRVPAYAEWTELRTSCTWTFTSLNSTYGYRIVGSNGNSIFLPLAGMLSGGYLYRSGSEGMYWSSSLYTDGSNSGFYLGDFDSYNYLGDKIFFDRYDKLSIRAVYDDSTPEEYTRDVTPGRYGTICLPKAVAHEDLEDCGGVFFKIVYAVTNTNVEITGILMEEETEGLEAGKPYIFRATADELVLPYTGEAVAEPVVANGLVGNLSETPLPVPQDMYVLSNNQIRKLAGGTATAGQNRAYIDLTSVTKLNYVPAAAPNRVVLNVEGSNVATDLENIKSEEIQKVIRDGQVLILRDGKTYNVLGNTL